ncbi:MAG: YitT family protein [Lachnospiraceae bacterium]|nr:YitT family protein [Lachnospiraceae bacterium]
MEKAARKEAAAAKKQARQAAKEAKKALRSEKRKQRELTKKHDWKRFWIDLLCDIIGGFLYAMGIYTFAKMANFSTGGISGLALIVNHLWNLPIGTMTLVMNIPLVLISWKVVGWKFLAKTARSMVICTVFLDILFPMTPAYTGSPMMAALYSGLLMGAGMAFFYMRGSSSGGMDFLIMTIKVRHPHFSFGIVTMISDFLVILLGWPAFGDADAVLYGLICSFSASLVLDKILYGVGAGKLVIIITNKCQEVAKRISEMTDRGSTVIRAIGSYTGEERQVILCACSKSQAYSITEAAHEVDEGSFVMVTETSEVFGEGFIEGK